MRIATPRRDLEKSTETATAGLLCRNHGTVDAQA